jgi:hypothetical protein
MAGASIVALRTLCRTFWAMLRVLDDIALTTNAYALLLPDSTQSFWRNFAQPDPLAPCPGGSGRLNGLCDHEWGTRGPLIPDTALLASTGGPTTS